MTHVCQRGSRREFIKSMALVSALSAWENTTYAQQKRKKLKSHLKKIVVVYLENRSFNNLFPEFPGLLTPVSKLKEEDFVQRDRNGNRLMHLPPIWGGLISPRDKSHQNSTAIQTNPSQENRPFSLKDLHGNPLSSGTITRDLCHLFYHNQMQINKGKNDSFCAWSDAGGLPMGYYGQTTNPLHLHSLARRFTLCDRFFMAAFGGSFLNHQFLIAAAPPFYPNALNSPAKEHIAQLEDGPMGYKLKLSHKSPASALDGPPLFLGSSLLTPDGYAVNTMAPAYQPSFVAPPPHAPNKTWADPLNPRVCTPQEHATIGDRLNAKGVSWAWYAGGWEKAQQKETSQVKELFQAHHQPFNYFKAYAPGTTNRHRFLKDAGWGNTIDTNQFLKAASQGLLPSVTFYKPEGALNMHAGYANLEDGDNHLNSLIAALEGSPDWKHMAVIVTFDENGGWWDHVAPPMGDRWGPGSRIPALVISPLAKKGHVEHTLYDTTSILKLICHTFDLDELSGMTARDAAFLARGERPTSDLTECFDV